MMTAQPDKSNPSSDDSMTCPSCDASWSSDERFARYGVCSSCGYHSKISAVKRIELLADDGTFEEFGQGLVSVDPLLFSDRLPYPRRVAEARAETGMNEAVVTGFARIRGLRVVLAILDFRFMGGSMGSVVGEKVTAAFERAADKKVPIITVAASGGARMQEGMLSLVQMAKTTAAAKRAHDSHIPYISVLTHPTTGGIYASFANQGDIILAEPGALIGFAGPRVIKQVSGRGELQSHTAEFLFEHGFVDQIVDRTQLRDTLATILGMMDSRSGPTVEREPVGQQPSEPVSAWDAVQIARHIERPTSRDHFRRMCPQFVELHGDRLYGDDPAVIGGLGEIAGRGVVFIGQERGHGDERNRGGQALPEGYRKAMRLLHLAARLRMPVVILVDTPGAFLGDGSEERGIATVLSECLALMSVLPVPIVSVIIGEGGSGGALALGVADRILMQERAIYSVIAPEGAAAILFRDASRAPEAAELLKITAADCKRLGVIDAVIPEPEGGAHRNPDFATSMLLDAVVHSLAELVSVPEDKLVRDRYRKFRRMGQHNTYFREMIGREASEWRERVRDTFDALRGRLPFGDHDDLDLATETRAEDTRNGPDSASAPH